MSAATVVLWRHGRTRSNAENRFQGQLDVPLDEVGRAQAAASAAHLAPLVAAGATTLVASDLSRALDTARALSALTGLEPRLDPALREVHAGRWQGLLHSEITASWPEDYAVWRGGGGDVRAGDGESRAEVAARTAGAVERHAAGVPDGGTLVVASHGAALKGALLRLLGLELSAWSAFAGFRNAHWAVLARGRHGWVLGEYNAGPPGAGEGAEG
ncbi:histidine phosphatase family protein [Paenibacillus sp. TRM 82003]|uniref:histidine phosphatase family protein n=1 Tax=Kineococcus sp. TRM81007 TaxID=2925831 RepID=UPI001F58F7CA|nr:histidine phosphatase family protein [Kineococcus sp. TRM81007]MCI2240074.1 histidine phosphatase family protein [Kineococcus sp. TRM81007]MCI3925620.1 histidine phosphatase family protein [Paenibacillus sp. TRM 82003]